MPSGAKKRKAAKRKIQQQQQQTRAQAKFSDKTNNNSSNIHGHDEQPLNKQENKCTKLENTVSQDQQRIKNDNEQKREPSGIQSFDGVNKSQENKKGERSNGGDVEVVKALNSEKDFNLGNAYVKSTERFHDCDKNSSKGSGHNALCKESQDAEKRSKEKANDSILKLNKTEDLVKPVDSLPKEVVAIDEPTITGITSSILKGDLIVDSAKQMIPASVSKEASSIPEGTPVDMLLATNEERALKKSNGDTIVSLPATDSAFGASNDKSVSLSNEIVQVSFATKENEATLSSGAHSTQTGNADTVKECHECCIDQPSVLLAVKKTPWWNCCGLFDALTSSDK